MKRILSYLLCMGLIVLHACKPEPEPEPYLSVSPGSLAFPQEGGAQMVRISANNAWTASVSGSGYSLSANSGTGDASLTVTAAAASATDPSSSTLTVTSSGLSATVQLTQEAKTVLLVGDSATIPAEGGSYEVNVQYNTDFTVEVESSAQSWITFVKTKAVQNGKLEFLFAANENTEPRTGKVTVKDKSGKVSPIIISFTQKEKKVIHVGETTTSPAEGGSYEVDVQYNTDFTVEVEASAQSWITFIKTRALQNGKLEFKFAANEDTEPRTGKVTVKDKSGKVEPLTITFVQERGIKIESLELDKTRAVLMPGETLTLTATIKPDNATDKTVYWQSTVKTVATVVDGVVTAVDAGTTYIIVRAGDLSARCRVTVETEEENRIRQALMRIYDAMDGPHWSEARTWGWSPDSPIKEWAGVTWDQQTHELKLAFWKMGLKGELPDCFDDLSNCTSFHLTESDVSGTLPSSFNKMKNLEELVIQQTSMTSLSDVFSGLPLKTVHLFSNFQMTGPLPESLGSNDTLTSLEIGDCCFTGTVPDSWARLGTRLRFNHLPLLSERVPDSFVTAPEAGYLINMYLSEATHLEKIMSVGDYDIPAYWPAKGLNDVITGQPIPFQEIVARNKATVLLVWGAWCPFSNEMMPILSRMYDKYHDAGLEIIACEKHDNNEMAEIAAGKDQKDYILDRGYEKWYNFVSEDFSFEMEFRCWADNGIPSARVVDSNGNIMYCGLQTVSDPSRNRFGYPASAHLVPLLEDLFGPLDDDGDYESTDYSRDGEVMTLQKATVGKGINVVFLGDAYTDKDMDEGGLYEKMMKQSMEEFFSLEPHKSFRNRFNVYAVKAVSKNGKTGVGYSTALSSDISAGHATTGSYSKCLEYALKVPEIDDTHNLLIGVLVNSVYHGGVAFLSESLQSGFAFYSSNGNNYELFGPTLRHEAGHGFAFLGDEYSNKNGSPSSEYKAEINLRYKEYGWFANTDFTNNPEEIRWSVFLSDDRYKNQVGIFEGGLTYMYGVYHPTSNSMMNQNTEFFNAPSRWAIYKRIMELSGEEYSFETFLEYDAVNRNPAAASAAAARPPLKAAQNFVPTTPPVVVP